MRRDSVSSTQRVQSWHSYQPSTMKPLSLWSALMSPNMGSSFVEFLIKIFQTHQHFPHRYLIVPFDLVISRDRPQKRVKLLHTFVCFGNSSDDWGPYVRRDFKLAHTGMFLKIATETSRNSFSSPEDWFSYSIVSWWRLNSFCATHFMSLFRVLLSWHRFWHTTLTKYLLRAVKFSKTLLVVIERLSSCFQFHVTAGVSFCVFFLFFFHILDSWLVLSKFWLNRLFC